MSAIVKYDAQGNELPKDSTDHVVLEFDGLLIDVSKRKPKPWKKAVEECGKVKLMGRVWRPATVKEIFVRTDLKRVGPAFDPTLFPNFTEYGWIWSGDEYADDDASSPVFAWGVSLRLGDADFSHRGNEGLALPVSSLGVSPGQS
jgi:hypothetical protein